MGKHYVIGLHEDGAAWILSLEHKSKEEAERAVRWQVAGGRRSSEFRICTYDKRSDVFVSEQGEEFQPDLSGFTAAAQARFRAELLGGK